MRRDAYYALGNSGARHSTPHGVLPNLNGFSTGPASARVLPPLWLPL